MGKLLAFLAFISITSIAQASIGAPTSKAEFCAVREDLDNVKLMTESRDNLMAFRNYGGIGNGGVCWWHSRFQRNALYLATFNPNATRDSYEKSISNIKKLRAGNQIVEINGYGSFVEFSYAFHAEIQAELERWQKADGIKKFRWMNGLKGRPRVSPDKMLAIVEELYQDVVVRKNITYQKLQVPGITAHAWLVVDVKVAVNGYDLIVLDSNLPQDLMVYNYRVGDTNFNHPVYGDFTPYTDHKDEMSTIRWVIKEYCK